MTIKKTVHIGQGAYGDVFCDVTFDGQRLSISGVEGPMRNGDAKGGCGQIVDSFEIVRFAPGWDERLVEEFKAVWRAWHLNDMKAGTPAQEEALARLDAELDKKYPDLRGAGHAQAAREGFGSYYEMALAYLEKAGLAKDPSRGDYKYGSAWLKVKVPLEVIDFLDALPVATKESPWGSLSPAVDRAS